MAGLDCDLKAKGHKGTMITSMHQYSLIKNIERNNRVQALSLFLYESSV